MMLKVFLKYNEDFIDSRIQAKPSNYCKKSITKLRFHFIFNLFCSEFCRWIVRFLDAGLLKKMASNEYTDDEFPSKIKYFNLRNVLPNFSFLGIVRYLGGRFPETTSAVDENGRTPLHYAATIDDNGHFYNLLMHLGSNPKVEDNVS
jgi:hypothetical protein